MARAGAQSPEDEIDPAQVELSDSNAVGGKMHSTKRPIIYNTQGGCGSSIIPEGGGPKWRMGHPNPFMSEVERARSATAF